MTTDPTIAALAGKLTASERRGLLGAKLADSHEWWAVEDIGNPTLASSDWVLTNLGVQLAHHLRAQGGS